MQENENPTNLNFLAQLESATNLGMLAQLENEWARIRQETQTEEQPVESPFPLWQIVTEP